jgi:hypothetical protein
MGTVAEVAEQFNLTPEQVKDLKQGMATTWNFISYDAYEFAHCYDSETEMITEMTLDAGRLEEYSRIGGMEVDWSFLDTKGLDIMALGMSAWKARNA